MQQKLSLVAGAVLMPCDDRDATARCGTPFSRMPLACSIRVPATPVPMHPLTLSATSAGCAPSRDDKSALTGMSTAADLGDVRQDPVTRDDGVGIRQPGGKREAGAPGGEAQPLSIE